MFLNLHGIAVRSTTLMIDTSDVVSPDVFDGVGKLKIGTAHYNKLNVTQPTNEQNKNTLINLISAGGMSLKFWLISGSASTFL